jgi:Na+-driven multidrug efflux pump
VLWVLALPTLFAAADQTACGIVLGISKHKPVVPVIIAEGLCNLALSIAWVRTMGVLGVAWGTAVPSLVSNLLFWPWYLRRALKVPISTYVKTAWILPMIAISPFAICSYVIERFWSAANLVVFFSQVALVLPLAAVGYWYVCFDAENRQALRQKLRRAAVHLGHAAGAKVMGGTNSST